MAKPKRDPVRENRIQNEVIVDAYGPDEQAMGRYYYLEDKIRFPFQATCITAKPVSPLLNRRFLFALAFLMPALTRSVFRLRSSSATAPKTVNTIRPAGVDVSRFLDRLTNANRGC